MSERREKRSSRVQDNRKEAVYLNENLPSTYKAARCHELEHKKVNYDLRKMRKLCWIFFASPTILSKKTCLKLSAETLSVFPRLNFYNTVFSIYHLL